MGLYIKGEKKPKNCVECFYTNRCEAYQSVWGKNIKLPIDTIYIITTKPKNCPMFEIEIENEK